MDKDYELELEDVPGMLNKVRRKIIDYYDHTREVGGVIMGYRERAADGCGGNFEVTHIIQMPNRMMVADRYRLPGLIRMIWRILRVVSIKQIMFDGVTIIGEFHSDYYGKFAFSKEDMEVIRDRCKRFGFWIAGVLVHRHRNIGRMGFKIYKRNTKTISKKPFKR